MKRLSLCLLFCLCISSSVNSATVLVRSGSFFFNPTNVVINPGDRILWTNTTVQTHDSRSVTSLWASPNLGNGGTFGFTFTNLGYYPYRCQQHALTAPQQTGTVSVVSISLANASRTPTNAQFEIRGGRTGLRAVVEAGTNVAGATAIRTNPFPANGTISFTDTNPPPARRFYRARVIP